MPGSPLRRQRQLGVRMADDSVVVFPFAPRVKDLPPGWRNFSPAARVEFLLRMPLVRAAEILTWPVSELDLVALSIWAKTANVVMRVAGKALLEGRLDQS